MCIFALSIIGSQVYFDCSAGAGIPMLMCQGAHYPPCNSIAQNLAGSTSSNYHAKAHNRQAVCSGSNY